MLPWRKNYFRPHLAAIHPVDYCRFFFSFSNRFLFDKNSLMEHMIIHVPVETFYDLSYVLHKPFRRSGLKIVKFQKYY